MDYTKETQFEILYNYGFDQIKFDKFQDFHNYVNMLLVMGFDNLDFTCVKTEKTTDLYGVESIEDIYFVYPKITNWGISYEDIYYRTDKKRFKRYVYNANLQNRSGNNY